MSTRRITRVALGVALFVVFGLALQVPVYQNYYVSLGYFVMAAWLYCFGIIDGTIVGTAGVVLYCVITGGMRGMPGWTLGNLVIGLLLGVVFKMSKSIRTANEKPYSKLYATCVELIMAMLAPSLGILVVKSFTEVVLYSQPMAVRMATNTPATIADIITLVLAVPVAVFVDRILRGRFPALAEAK